MVLVVFSLDVVSNVRSKLSLVSIFLVAGGVAIFSSVALTVLFFFVSCCELQNSTDKYHTMNVLYMCECFFFLMMVCPVNLVSEEPHKPDVVCKNIYIFT